jgi:sugar-phosphatase
VIFCVPIDAQDRVGHGWGRAHAVATVEVDSSGQLSRWTVHEVGWDAAHDQGTHGAHHARIVRFLRDHQVGGVVAEHMGVGMLRVMRAMGIPVFLGAAGDARAAVQEAAALLAQAPADPALPAASGGSGTGGAPAPPPGPRSIEVAALIADMDGTLVDSHAAVRRVWTEWAASRQLDPDELLAFAAGRRPESTLRRFDPDNPDIAAAAAALQAQEIALTEGIAEVPGAAKLLDGIVPGKPLTALVTSASRALARARMEAAGLAWPAVAVCAEDVAEGKPAPDGYLRAAAELAAPIADCLVLEDSAAGAWLIVVGGAPGRPGHPRQLAAVADLEALSARRTANGRLRLDYPAPEA